MRTARTIAVNADGSEVILAASSVPVADQAAAFRGYAVTGLPSGVVRIDYCTSDGRTRSLSAAALAAVAAAERRAEEKSLAGKEPITQPDAGSPARRQGPGRPRRSTNDF